MIHLNIGSNRGDRQALISLAVALIQRRWPSAAVAASAPVESEPWGYESAHPYLNVGVALDGCEPLRGGPVALLRELQQIERAISDAPHRHPDGTYADRYIDIDIICITGVRLRTPSLIIPHPRAHLRPFVTGPLAALGGNLHE